MTLGPRGLALSYTVRPIITISNDNNSRGW